MRLVQVRQYQTQSLDLDKIRRVAGNSELTPEEVFDFPKMVICRSGKNHNRTEITREGQQAAVAEWIGKPVYFRDHETTAENQIGRVYDAWVEEVGGETITYGRAFAIRTDDEADLQAKIKNRIHQEMSCGYEVLKSACSICANDTTLADCVLHSKQPEYFARDLEIKPDHISFVGRPAVEGAGLTAHSRQADEADPALQRLAEDGKVFREWTSQEFTRWYGLNNPQSTQEEIEGLTSKLSAREMIRLSRIEQSRFKEIIPDGRQKTMAPVEEQGSVKGPQFSNINDLYRKER